jgi:hypothetical protein
VWACAKLAVVPRHARVVAVDAPHHVTQRGNNLQKIFFHDAIAAFYLALLADQSRHGLRNLGLLPDA